MYETEAKLPGACRSIDSAEAHLQGDPVTKSSLDSTVQYRQGDVFILAAAIPDTAKPTPNDPRGLVLAAGTATGHHHRIAPAFKNATLLRTDDGARTYLRVTKTKGGAKLKASMAKDAEKARAAALPLETKLSELGASASATAIEVDTLIAEISTILEPVRMYESAKREVDMANGAVGLTHDEHDEVVIPPGEYEVYIQREYQPGGVQMVED